MSVLENAIGLLSPPECLNCGTEGSALCGKCIVSVIPAFGECCWRCQSLSSNCRICAACRHIGSPAHVWIATVHDGAARDLLSVYKFGHQRAAAEPIARMMSSAFAKFNKQGGNDYIAVPIPTATARIRERSFGHAELLSKKVATSLGLRQANVLRRLGQIRQLGSRREDRLKQLESSFAVRRSNPIAGRRILLIDDVVTTGGTLIAATRALHAAGARQVDALLFAKRL